jgi:hypothetical protein
LTLTRALLSPKERAKAKAIEDRICDEQSENQQGCKQKVVGQRWHMDTFRMFSATRDVFAHLACHAHLAASEQTVVDARFWPNRAGQSLVSWR